MALIYVVEDDKNISEIESFAFKKCRTSDCRMCVCKGVSQAGTGADTGYGAA